MNQFEHTYIAGQSSSPAVRDLLPGGEGMNLLVSGFESSYEENMVRH